MLNDMFAELNISNTSMATLCASPWPPYSGSQAIPVQPPSRNVW